MLKEELRNMERSQKREGVDMTYLKNVIVKLLETGIFYFYYITKKNNELLLFLFLLIYVYIFFWCEL